MNRLDRQVPDTSLTAGFQLGLSPMPLRNCVQYPVVVMAMATSALELPSVVIWLVTLGAAGSCFCVSAILMLVPAMNFLNQNSYDLPKSLSASRIATVVPFGYLVFR